MLGLLYKYIVLGNHALSRYFCTSLQLHNSPVSCARELFKRSKDSAKFFTGSYVIEYIRSLSGTGPQLQEGSILLKFLLETRLKSESFEPFSILSFGVIFTQN